MSVRIITDSASDMSPTEHPALHVLPLSVSFGTDVYMDGVDIDHQRFYEMLVERDELPKTGQVNPYAFSQAIAEAREAGDEAVIITVGAKLSGTNQSARTALAEMPGGDVFVVDSNNVTLGERVLVEYALRLVDEGRGAAEIAAAVEAVRDRVVVIGLLETLEYLVRGGRLSAAAGAVGTLLNVKPVVAAEDGLIVQLGKARGSKNGRNLLNQKVEKAGGVDFSMPLALGYTGLSDAVLKKYIEDSADENAVMWSACFIPDQLGTDFNNYYQLAMGSFYEDSDGVKTGDIDAVIEDLEKYIDDCIDALIRQYHWEF